MMNTKYVGSTHTIPGATNLDTVGVISIEEGYVINGSTEFISLGNFESYNRTSSSGDQSNLVLELKSLDSKLNTHSLVNSIEYKTPYFWHDTFNDTANFTSNYSISPGVTISGGQVSATFDTSTTTREIVHPNSFQMDNVRIYARMAKNSNSLVTQLNTYFRYTDGSNTFKIKYQNGRVYLQDVNSGYDSGITLVTKNGVSITPNADYHMMTTVYNNRVIHSGSTDGVNYTNHIDYTGLYNWTVPYPNDSGLAAISVAGVSGGVALLKEFMVSEIEDQQTYESAQRTIFGSIGIDNVNIQKDLDGFSTLSASSGSSWVSGASGSLTRISATAGNSWATYFTTGTTFNDFVLECDIVGLSGSYPGLAFGSTESFYLFYINMDGSATQTELYSGARFIMQSIQTPFVPTAGVKYSMKLIKQGIYASWYINGLRMTEVVGTSILNNSDSKNVRIGVVTSRDGVSVTFSDIRISSLDKLADTFKIEAGDNLSLASDRFLPGGFVRTTKQDSVDIFRKGSSRANFNITDSFQSPTSEGDVQLVPNLVEVRGIDLVAYVGNTSPLSRGYFSKTKSYITNDENIFSSREAMQFGREILNEENSKSQSYTLQIDANPTLERYDQVSFIDPTFGVSINTLVESSTKSYSADGSFKQDIKLTII